MSAHEECVLCGSGIVHQDGDDAYDLIDLETDEPFGGVCSNCIKNDLNNGNATGDCIHCDDDPDYGLQPVSITISTDRSVIKYTSGVEAGILCENGYEKLAQKSA
jgi:hypothetical protein